MGPPAPPASTVASTLFAQGSGDTFGASTDNGILEAEAKSTALQQNAMSKCRDVISEPFLSLSIRSLSDLLEHIESIILPSLLRSDDGTSGKGIWINSSPHDGNNEKDEECKPMLFLPGNNPFYGSVSSLRDIMQSGQEIVAGKALKILEEATTRLMLSQEANQEIEAAQLEGTRDDSFPHALRQETGLNDDTLRAVRQGFGGEEADTRTSNGISNASDLLLLAKDGYRETYTSPKIKDLAAAVISPSLINPALTSFNDNNKRTSANDDNSLNKYGVSLETKAYQFEFMIIYMLNSLHENLRRPELLSDYVESSIRVLFSQFLADLSSAECPVLDAISGYADMGADDMGLFGKKRSNISMELELIELDLKVQHLCSGFLHCLTIPSRLTVERVIKMFLSILGTWIRLDHV